MTKHLPRQSLLALLVFICFNISAEESKTYDQAILSALLAAKSDEDRSLILESNKNAITVELRKALIEEGNKLRVKNDFPGALTLYNLAKRVAEQIGDRAGVGHSLRGIGILHDIEGNRTLALDHLQKSLAIANEVNDKTLTAGCLRSLAYVELDEDSDLAMEYCQKSLQTAEESQDKLQIAAGYYCVGSFNMEQGNYALALEFLEKSLVLQKEIGNKELAASNLNSIAIVYDRQGNYELAMDYYQKSLALREIGDRLNAAYVLSNMGDVRLLKSLDMALEYNKKSLTIAEELGDKRLAVRACTNIGNKYRDKGDYDQALKYALKSLEIAKGINYGVGIADSQRLAATVYYLKSDYEKSLEFADRAVTEAKKIGVRQSIWNALQAKGRAHRLLNQQELARKSFEEAIATIEDWRSLVAGDEMERQGHFSERVSPYHEMIDLLVTEGDSSKAFAYAEVAKARVLLDVARSGKINITEKMTQEEKDQERKSYKELTSLNRQIREERMNSKPDQKRLDDLEMQVEKARLNFESFRTKLYAIHPELKVHRGEANPVEATEAIELFADTSTVLLEYVVTDNRTFLFFLNSEKKIPSVYTIPITQEDLAKRVANFRIKMGAGDPGFLPIANTLFELLVGPIVKDL